MTMSNNNTFRPPPPTWRLCHPVNIYVYQNGVEHSKPALVHIPMEKKKNMTTVLEEIGARMKLVVGYPVALYNMDGSRICKTYELEMYNNYVMVTNLDKRFKCADYGTVRDPLVVIGRCSKHVNTLKVHNKRFDLFCRAKMRRNPLHVLMARSGDSDGYGPDQIPVQGKNCGALCTKVAPQRDRLTQCCSDEIMCVEGETLEQDPCQCEVYDRAMLEQKRPVNAPPSAHLSDDGYKLIEQLQRHAGADNRQCGAEGAGPLGVNQNLIDLMVRYKDVGSDIFKLFQDKINRDIEGGHAKEAVSNRWQIPGESNVSLTTEQRLKEELIRLAEASCQFSFDKQGNFVSSDGCRVPGAAAPQEGSPDNVVVGSDYKFDRSQVPNEAQEVGTKKSQSAGSEAAFGTNGIPLPTRISERRGPDEEEYYEEEDVNETMAKINKGSTSSGNIIGVRNNETFGGGGGPSKNMRENEEEQIKDQRKVSVNSYRYSNDKSNDGGKRASGNAPNIFKNNPSGNGNDDQQGARGGANENDSNDKSNPSGDFGEDYEEEYNEEGDNEPITSPNKSNNSGRNNENFDNDEDGGVGETNVFSVFMQYRNPFKEGLVTPLAGKLHKDRLDKLFAENPFRKHWFHEEESLRNDARDEDEFVCLHKTEFPLEEEFGNMSLNLPPPPETACTPLLSPRDSRTEWWPTTKPTVFLQQINELVHRYDNTKATSPPPPLPTLEMSNSSRTFTIGPSPRSSCAMLTNGRSMVNVACGRSITEISTEDERIVKLAEMMAELEKAANDDKREEKHDHDNSIRYDHYHHRSHKTRKNEVELLEQLPSEDEKPAGIYEGYQESIKSKSTDNTVPPRDEVISDYDEISDNGEWNMRRKMCHSKRRENRRLMRKRKEHDLRPCNIYPLEENKEVHNYPFIYFPSGSRQPNEQQIRFVFGNQQEQQQLLSAQSYPYLQQQGPQQQPFLVQSSAATPTTLPLLARHSTHVAPGTLTRFIRSNGSAQLPYQIRPQQQLSGNGNTAAAGTGLVLPFVNNMLASSSPFLRQPMILMTAQSPQLDRSKFLPALLPPQQQQQQPQNTHMRLIRFIAPTPQQQQIISTAPVSTGGGGVLQTKLVQFSPAYQTILPNVQTQIIRPQMQQQQQQQQPRHSIAPQQFIFK